MPIKASQRPTWSRKMLKQLLNTLSANPAAVGLITPKIHLLQAAVVITPDTPLATFVAAEATFTGYVAQAIALPLLGPVNANALGEAVFNDNDFILAAPGTITNNIYGFWCDSGAGPDWFLAELFDAPIPMAVPGDFITMHCFMELMFQVITI